MTPKLYPLFLDLGNKPVLVVGAGAVGAGKALALAAAGAVVTVVAPHAVRELSEAALRGQVRWEARSFRASDLDGVYLVVAATDAAAVNAEVAQAAAERRLFVNAVDDPQHATAYAAAVLHRGPLTVALSSGGRAPGLMRLMRTLLETILPKEEDMSRWVAQTEELRRAWRTEKRPMAARYRELVAALYRDTQRGTNP